MPLNVLSHSGPLYTRDYPDLFAAPSLIDLQGLIYGLGSNPRLSDCQRSQEIRRQCWLDIADPGGAVLVAAYIDIPCAQSTASATLSGPDEITITVVDQAVPVPPGFLPTAAPSPKPGECPKGAPRPATLSLLDIPFTAVPADELTIEVVHPALQIPIAKTVVDLKDPLNISRNLNARIAEVRAATEHAFQDAMTRVQPGASVGFLELGTQQWPDTRLGCPVVGGQYAAVASVGYVVLLKGSDQPSLAIEYHESGNLQQYCGRVAP
ncbi:MAG: hypothetical protein ACYDAL_16470 [Candidatus Dormibacteraceae bacterium]